jgi:hypothetical protein
MMGDDGIKDPWGDVPTVTWQGFLLSRAPGQFAHVEPYSNPLEDWQLFLPSLDLFCKNCGHLKNASAASALPAHTQDGRTEIFHEIQYICHECKKLCKEYYVTILNPNLNSLHRICFKKGEWPLYRPAAPSKLVTLLGKDRDALLKGVQAESMGLGVGAFAYYRQIVEAQKNRILGEILKVAELEKNDAVATAVRAAMMETQFTKAAERIKEAFPESLKISSHNPMTLLHDALSDGLHAKTDADCLELASDIRIVLTEFATRVSEVLKDDAKLKEAVNRLTLRKRTVSS